MGFLDFRDYLVPASGFQSLQFRQIEVLLGLPIKGRRYGTEEFLKGVLNESDNKELDAAGGEISLSQLIEKWLERMPFQESEDFQFWREYQAAVKNNCGNVEQIKIITFKKQIPRSSLWFNIQKL